MPQKNALSQRLSAQIREQGPLRLDHYIQSCLWDVTDGYYLRDDVFGAKGDFTTSPEISQIFGEVIGLWAITAWQEMGSPSRFTLLEMGAGRGTLMRDFLRTAALSPEFLNAIDLHILEKSPARQAEQRQNIGKTITFLDTLDLPAQPAIILSNEFFDALPIRQFRNEDGGWLEAFIDENIQKIWQPCPRPPKALAPFRDIHGVIEVNETAIAIASQLGTHVSQHGGHILTIDYGDLDGSGDTFQAVQNHQPVDPFEAPGEADLTAHIRFRDLAEAAKLDCNFMTQADFLNHYGAALRLEQLSLEHPSLAENLASGYARLTAPNQMGEIFKVLIQRAAT